MHILLRKQNRQICLMYGQVLNGRYAEIEDETGKICITMEELETCYDYLGSFDTDNKLELFNEDQ